MKFRKKPVVIDALQWTGSNLAELKEFTGDRFRTVESQIAPGEYPSRQQVADDITGQVLDVLHDTWVGVKTGQWVIRGVQGEYYPIDPEVLASTYDRVEGAA